MYLAGQRNRDIAKQLAVNEMTVGKWASRLNWKEQREKLITSTTKAIVMKAEVVKNDLIARHQEKLSRVINAKMDSLEHFPAEKSQDFEYQAKALKTFDDTIRRIHGLDISESGQRGSSNVNLFLGSHDPSPLVNVTPEVIENEQAKSTEG